MYLQRKLLTLCAAAISLAVIALLHHFSTQDSSHGSFQSGGHDRFALDAYTYPRQAEKKYRQTHAMIAEAGLSSDFHPGLPESKALDYSRVMVIPRMKEEDIMWIAKELPDLNVSVYVADDPSASLHPPRNKGHEVMVYLTYIIDHYSNLPDIVLFMHAHRWTHHNNDLLGHDAVQMLHRLNNAYVIRNGYMNMRCHWSPGCPEWLYPVSTQELLGKQEETVLSKCWGELFPLEPIPTYLAQPCCAQFALSKERLLAIPLSRFVFYRDWILRTPLSDYISGRVWEYSWQFIFTGQHAYCPAEHLCYCDGFGLCFGGEAQYKDFIELGVAKNGFEAELEEWRQKERTFEEATQKDSATGLQALDSPRYAFVKEQIEALSKELVARKQNAIERGSIPQYRAEECGRYWQDGDSF